MGPVAAEDQKPSMAAPLTPTTVGSNSSSPKSGARSATVLSPRTEVPFPELGSMIGASLVQGEVDIYTNPPANYQMYPRKLAAPKDDVAPASAILTPAKAVSCAPEKIQEGAMIGGAFIQGEADIYSNPPANYQMYPRTLRNSPVGVEEQKQGFSTFTPSTVEFLQQRLLAKTLDVEELVVGIDLEEAVEWQEFKKEEYGSMH